LPETLPKIAELRAMIDSSGHDIDLGVDGGINVDTAQQVVEAGANVLIAGSTIFNNRHSVAAGIEGLRASLKGIKN
jgi:ribulose-phosphate 3-epimerase